MSEVLIVDDERSMREFLEILFRKEGFGVRCAENVAQAVELAESAPPDLLISDLKMKGGSGLDLLRKIKARLPEVEVIIITAFATMETAIEALKLGAYDYVNKPFQVDEIRVVAQRALERQRLLRENSRMRTELTGQCDFGHLVGRAPRMQEAYRLIEQVAPTRSNVLITGESGTGKELVARAIHMRSGRRDGPFVAIDCASIPEQLMEGELFGHVKGAFTGATADHTGLFELADSGTVFLDEIGEVPPSIQVKLLRVIQERAVRKLGEGKDRSVDVRILAATNRDIDEDVRRGAFREDLFFRLNVIRIHVPALRDRREDIPLLTQHFVEKVAGEEEQAVPLVLREALDALAAYDFPGNVRELQNMVERAVALSGGKPIGAELFHVNKPPGPAGEVKVPEVLPQDGLDLDGLLSSLERRFLVQALERSGGVKKDAAEILGISFRSIRYRLLKHGLG